jgi:hypothetical protein
MIDPLSNWGLLNTVFPPSVSITMNMDPDMNMNTDMITDTALETDMGHGHGLQQEGRISTQHRF